MGFRLLLIAAGGAVGSLARFAVFSALPDRAAALPATTLSVNVAGAFLLGVVASVWARDNPLRLLLGTGVLGGFTTFGSVSVQLVQQGQRSVAAAGVYALVMVAGGCIAAALGHLVGRGAFKT